MACIFQTRQIGWHNRAGFQCLTKSGRSAHTWTVCVGTIIFIFSLTSSYCSLPNANRALHTGTPSYGNKQLDNQINANTAHMHIVDPIPRAHNTICKLSHCKHWTVLCVLVFLNKRHSISDCIILKYCEYHNYATVLHPGVQQTLLTFSCDMTHKDAHVSPSQRLCSLMIHQSVHKL